MNKILIQLEKYMYDSLKLKVPNVSKGNLEKDGAIFYMNGKNGTEFEWFVNDHFPCFFIFYNDEENLGAVKAILYKNGDLLVYVYGENGHSEPERLDYKIEAEEKELLNLAVSFKKNADEKRVWDEDITMIENDTFPDEKALEEFVSHQKDYEPIRERILLLSKTAIVSKKVREGNWMIGYGMRSEPTRERDSGWYFCVGDEDEEYVNNPENLELWMVNSVLMRDPEVREFIEAPYGTAIIRVAPDKFEVDKMDKEIFISHRV